MTMANVLHTFSEVPDLTMNLYLKEIFSEIISFKVHTVAKKFNIIQIKRQFEDDQRLI